MRHRHRRSLQRSLTDSEAAGSAPHPSAPHALGPEHARREHRSLPSRPMYMHAAVPSFWEVAMLSVPVFDSWEGPKRQSAIGDAILGKKFFPAYAHTLPVRPLGEGGPKTFFSETASTLRRAGQQCLWRRRHAESKPFRRVYGVRGGYHCARRTLRDLSRIAHAHARKPNDSRRKSSTPIARICVHGLKRCLSGGSCLHDTDDSSFVTQPASSTSYAHYTRRLTYPRSRVSVSCAAGSQRFVNASSFSWAGIPPRREYLRA